MKNRKIWLSLAEMGGGEQKYIEEAFRTNWVVPLGPNVDAFEEELATYLGYDKHIVALSSGTAAIHLGLLLAGVEADDEVICQSFTFAASANPIVYLGARPVFVDSESNTWNLSPELLEEAIIDRKLKTGKYPKAIVTIHLYGMPAQMERIAEVAEKYGIPVVEDAAEALGSEYKERKCGTFGKFGILSFNGNKIITTSGGGVLICEDRKTADLAKFYATQARENRPYYYHEKLGYNYRLSNICAGIGRGQMEVLEHHLTQRRRNHRIYAELLGGIPGIGVHSNPERGYDSNFWLTCLTVAPESGTTPDQIRCFLETQQIESRLLWRPMHLQPVFETAPFYGNGTSEKLFNTGLCLPSGSALTGEEVGFVAGKIKEFIQHR